MVKKFMGLAAVLMLSTQAYAGSEKEWKELSLLCQNVGYDYCQLGGPRVGLIPEWNEKDRGRINAILDLLVERGELAKFSFKVKLLKNLTKDQSDGVNLFFEKLGGVYGKFVVAEMLDMGFKSNEAVVKPDDDVFNVRLPAKELERMKLKFKELGILAESK